MSSTGERWTAVYVRISAQDQKDASQRLALQQYVHRQNISPTKWYRDTASGKNLERPGWKELQKDIFEGCVSAVLVFRLDRIARNLQDGVNVLADLCKKNVRVISISEQIDLSGTVGQMVAALIVGLADLERQAILSRIRAGIAARKANGLPTGRRRGTHPKWSLAKRRIDPLLAKFLRDQDVPLADIAAKFNASVSGVRAALRAKNL